MRVNYRYNFMTIPKSKKILRGCSWRVHFQLNTTSKGLWIRLTTLCWPLLSPVSQLQTNALHERSGTTTSCVSVRVWLHSHFTVRWIRRGGQRPLPNPDITKSDFLSGIAPEDTWWNEQQIRDALIVAVPLDFFWKRLKSVSSRLQRCVKNDWAYF